MHAQIPDRFESILFPTDDDDACRTQSADAIHDLALDQVFDPITRVAPRASVACRVLQASVPDVMYRQEVFQALEQPELRSAVDRFLASMAVCDRWEGGAARASYPYQAELWRLSAITGYVTAVQTFATELPAALTRTRTRTHGWQGLARHLSRYLASPTFGALKSESLDIAGQIAAVRYNALIRDGGRVAIARTDDEPDLREAVLATFERFRQGDETDHRTTFREVEVDHVQAWMLERAAELHAGLFENLVTFTGGNKKYRDRVLAQFADDVRFYLAYLDYVAPLRQAGLPLCYPDLSPTSKDLAVTDCWDLALAAHAHASGDRVVTNDLSMSGSERILVISGPNQGGKTTTARMFGQLHYLAALGCPVPAREARLFLCDQVLTIFDREERLDTIEGRLGDQVQRLRAMFDQATGRTIIVMNEVFSSTALHDARILTADVLARISDLDALAVCVTFIDELSRLNEKTVSMVSQVDPEDPALRTFRVERRPADGRAYARALAAKHGLTLNQARTQLHETDERSADQREAAS